MERRFGCDFSRVRVHTDGTARDLSQAVDARAFTFDRSIAFGEGEYAPHTREGQKLIAHELAHVLQQGAATADRVSRLSSPEYRVTDMFQDRARYPSDVFFDWNEPDPSVTAPEEDIDQNEADKVAVFAHRMTTQQVSDVTLYGYASEEGNRAYNQRLAERRVEAVANLMIDAGYQGMIVHQTELHKSEGQVDYRYWRAVEMKPDGEAPRRTGSTAVHASTCNPNVRETVRDVRDDAVELIEDAVDDLRDYESNPTNDPRDPVVRALNNNFDGDHRVATALSVRQRLEAMRGFLSQQTLIDQPDPDHALLKCGDEEESSCRAGGIATANPRQLMVCRAFFEASNSSRRDEVLVHESAHGSTYRVRDRAYTRERVYVLLTRDQALDNAQSLTIFVLELHNRRPPVVGPLQQDVITGCDPGVTTGNGPNEGRVRRAMAWAQRWNTYAVFGVAQTYGDADKEARMGPYFYRWFGRTDRTAMAGINDRYERMDKEFEKQVTISCVGPSDVSCAQGRHCVWAQPASVVICPSFLSLDELNQIIKIYAALARIMPDVPERHAESYPRLAKDYKEQYWRILG